MKLKARKCVLFRIVSLCVTLVFCLRITIPQSPPLLCSQQEVDYKGSQVFSVATTEEKNLDYAKLLQDILRSYQHSHAARRRELVAGTTASTTLTWYCISDCQGIGDRVMGMYTAFLLALVTNRTFFIHLSDEVHKTMFLEPNAIDWRPVHKCIELHHDQTVQNFSNFAINILGMTKNLSLELNRLSTINNIYISHKRDLLDTTKGIFHSTVLLTNLTSLHLRLLRTVLTSGYGASLHSFSSVLYKFLFSQPEHVQKMRDSRMTDLNLQPGRFVTVHIRTGFKNSFVGEIVPYSLNYWKGNRFARSKESWRNMMNCALNISNSKFGTNSRVLVVADDREPKNWAASEYKSRVTMLDIDPVHVAIKQTLGVLRARSREDYLDTWVELSVMAQSWAIVGIYSGYAEVASHMGSIDPTSLYFYDIPLKTCGHLYSF